MRIFIKFLSKFQILNLFLYLFPFLSLLWEFLQYNYIITYKYFSLLIIIAFTYKYKKKSLTVFHTYNSICTTP